MRNIFIVSAKFSTHLYSILQFFKFLFVATAGKAADSKAPLTGMPMVADGRGVGVKNRENLPTS